MQSSCPLAWLLFSRLDLSSESLKNWGIIKMVTCSSVDKGNVFVCVLCLKLTIACHAFHSLCSPLVLAFTGILPFLFVLLSSYWCPVFSVLFSDLLTHLWVFRLNNLKRAAADTLEGNKSVAYMDLRDNQMTDLDLSSLVSLEQLHCERNKLRELTLSGFSLRALYANSNCMSLCLLRLPFPFKPWEQRKTAFCPLSSIKKPLMLVLLWWNCMWWGPLRLAPKDHICMHVHSVEIVVLCPRN